MTILKTAQHKGQTSERLTVLLVATDTDKPEVRAACASLVRFGYSYQILGRGDRWGGWRHRMQLYLTALHATVRLHGPTALVVLMDAYDALAMRPARELPALFRVYDRPVLLSLERVCGGNGVVLDAWWKGPHAQVFLQSGVSSSKEPLDPGKGCAKRDAALQQEATDRDFADCKGSISYTMDTTPHLSLPSLPSRRYVNGGLVMGEAQPLADAYKWMLDDPRLWDDQVGLGRWALAHPTKWAPDLGTHPSVNGRLLCNVLCEPSFLAQRELMHDATTLPATCAAALRVASASLRSAVWGHSHPALEVLSDDDLAGRGCFFAHFPGLRVGSAREYVRALAALKTERGPHREKQSRVFENREVDGNRVKNLTNAEHDHSKPLPGDVLSKDGRLWRLIRGIVLALITGVCLLGFLGFVSGPRRKSHLLRRLALLPPLITVLVCCIVVACPLSASNA